VALTILPGLLACALGAAATGFQQLYRNKRPDPLKVSPRGREPPADRFPRTL